MASGPWRGGLLIRLTAAWVLLALFRLLTAVLPFPVVRRMLGEDRAGAEPVVETTLGRTERARAIQISAVVQAAAARTPWRSDCYPQALAARTFLAARRIPHVVSFGVRRENGELRAHTWVRAGDVPVTGGDGSRYAEVATFVWLPRHRDPS